VHQTQGFEIELDGVKSMEGVKKYLVTGSKWDVINTEVEQQVGIEESEWDGKGKCAFPKLSMTMLRWKA
jgi:alpha-L-arabinofuranosidase